MMQKLFSLGQCKVGVISLLVFLCINGCTSSDKAPTAASSEKEIFGETGDWTLAIGVYHRDEFFRPLPAFGNSTIKLVANDRSVHYIIPSGDSLLALNNVPYQQYIASVEKAGYFPGAEVSTFSFVYKTISLPIYLFSLPSEKTRIDSIKCYPNTVSPQVRIRFYTAQRVPVDGTRSAVLFFALGHYVSSTLGTYINSIDGIIQIPGSSEILTEDIYRQLYAAGIPSGTLVYVTGRIKTGATVSRIDNTTGLTIYDNLEENTKAVASFIMP